MEDNSPPISKTAAEPPLLQNKHGKPKKKTKTTESNTSTPQPLQLKTLLFDDIVALPVLCSLTVAWWLFITNRNHTLGTNQPTHPLTTGAVVCRGGRASSP